MRTEGKWYHDPEDNSYCDPHLKDCYGGTIRDQKQGLVLATIISDYGKAEAEANAQFICKAVNNHEALVEALAECAHELDQMLLSHHAQEAYLQARAALKEAE